MTTVTKADIPDIDTPEGMAELEEKLKGLKLNQETYLNAPESLDAAIQRIMEVEMHLEDLARAVELAQITGQINLVEGFRLDAERCLVNKITIDRPLPTETMKITVITDNKDGDS